MVTDTKIPPEPLFSEDKKLIAQGIQEMLLSLKKDNDDLNQLLYESNESKFAEPFEQVYVADIKDYVLKLLGADDEFVDL